jgi:hypothetical protein
MTTLALPRSAVKPARKPRTVKAPTGTVRLTLHINGVGYAARPLAVQPGSGVSRLVRLRKGDGTAYHVHRDEHGCGCDCPDFTFSREGIDPRGCKHVVALAAVGLL